MHLSTGQGRCDKVSFGGSKRFPPHRVFSAVHHAADTSLRIHTSFMNYSDDTCMDHFTPGQIAFMRAFATKRGL